MIAAFILGLVAMSSSSPLTVREAAAVARLSRCGVPRDIIRARTDGTDAIELTVGDGSPPGGEDIPTNPDIDCAVAAAIEGDFWVEFVDGYVGGQFNDAYDIVKRARTRIVATRWLVARHMLKALPVFDAATESLAAFGRRIEAFCAVKPGAVVHQYDVMVLAYKKRPPGSTVADAQIECLSNAFGASNLNNENSEFFYGFVVDQAGAAAEGRP